MTTLLIIPLFSGLFAGLIINYLADVLPITRSFSRPMCSHCNSTFSTKDYLLMRSCQNGHKRNIRTWSVLIIIIGISIYTWLSPPEKIGFALGMLLITYLGLIFVIDLEHRLILHPTSIFGAVLGLITGIIKRDIGPTLLGALGGLTIMLFFYFFGVLFTKIREKRMLATAQETDDEEALGAGDVILVTILGLIVGWPVIGLAVLIGILLGGFVSFILLIYLFLSGKYDKNALMMFIPYGPYFITSTFVIVFLPEYIKKILPG